MLLLPGYPQEPPQRAQPTMLLTPPTPGHPCERTRTGPGHALLLAGLGLHFQVNLEQEVAQGPCRAPHSIPRSPTCRPSASPPHTLR